MSGEPCHICGRPIDLSLPRSYVDPADGRRKPAPWSLEVDEIVPVSLGGSPTDPANVAPAHRICNQRRGNRPLGSPPASRPSAEGRTSRDW
ncbi:MAG: HNH endonuclease [Atopobiaceae bacterium]|nr:HNH endonuclease [Atopobiaceae bacterium]